MRISKKISCSILSLLFVLGIALPEHILAQGRDDASVFGKNDRIGWSADGNNNDPDDWGATPIALAIWAKMGWQDKLVHFDYNSRLDDNKDWKYKENNESTLGAARKFRFDISKFFDDQNQLDEAVANLAKEINASSEDSRLWIGVAGPFEVVYRGIQAADSSKRKYCTLVSHSPMNEKAGKWKLEDGSPSPGKDDCVALGVQYLKIKTGNGCGDAFGSGTCQKWEEVEWLKNSPDPRYNWIWDRLEATRLESAKQTSKPNGKLDASDCTMAYYLAYNDENGNFIKLHEKLGNRLRHDNYGNPDKLDVIIIEAESVSPSGGWFFETKHEGYCGNGYLFYTGPNLMKENLANSSLVYKFKIKKEGKYNIWWRGRRDYGENCPDDAKGDACNDIWASLDGSELSKKLVKPPFGEWGWGTPDTDYVPFSEHLSVGEHVLKIGGRSHGVKLDQIVILPESMGKPVTNDCLD